MSAAGGRTTRSRFSSPYTSSQKESPKEFVDRNGDVKPKRGSQEGWQEPPIPQPKPSFAEAGMERHGVVANMAALGTRPSAKIMKGLLRSENVDGGSRRSRRETSVASTPAESLETRTPEPTQTPELVQTPEPVDPTEPEPESIVEKELAEEDTPVPSHEEEPGSANLEPGPVLPLTPQLPPTHSFDSRMSLPIQSPVTSSHGPFPSRPLSEPYMGNQGVVMGNFGQPGFAMQPSPMPLFSGGVSHPVVPIILPLPAFGPDNEFVVNLDRTDSVIEHAVQAALDDGRWPTAYALRTLYDDKRSHNPSVRVIEAVYGGFATPEQRQDFLAQVTQRKREGRKDRFAEYYFNGDGSDFAPPPRRASVFSPNGIPVFNANLFTSPTYPTQNPPKYQTPYSPLPASGPPSGSFTSNEAIGRPTSIIQRSASPPKLDEDEEPPAKKHKPNDFDASEGDVIVDTVEDASAPSQLNGMSKSPEQRASRSGSVSSSSSLSSLNEDVLNTSTFNSPLKPRRQDSTTTAEMVNAEGGPLSLQLLQINPELAKIMFPQSPKEFVSPYASKENFEKIAETLAGPPPGARIATQPIKAAPKAGPKTFLFSIHKPSSSASATSAPATNTPPNASQTQPTSTTTTRAKSSMAPAAVVSSSSTSTTTASTPLGNPPTQGIFRTKGLNKLKAQTPPVPYDANDSANRMKRKVRERTNRNTSANESFERHQVTIPLLPEVDSDVESIAVRPPKKPPVRVRLNTRTRNTNYDSEDNSSPTLLSFQPDLAPGSVATSRAGTPNNLNRPTRKGKPGTGLRVKTSPMKKKGGTLAGLPRPSGERNSPSGGLNGVAEDNDDYCSSCGGNGSLVCCDGCTRSFHYQCVDPPMIESALPDDPWFCNVCQSSRQPPPPPSEVRGAFGSLLFKLNEKNPSAFQLPLGIRECFEGVKTGVEGEYEDIVAPKSRGTRPGWEEQPDYFRTRDAKGNLILCYHCNSTAAAPDRKIVACTFCTNYWHLDCVPNPLAKEPGVGRQWRCPLHVDDLLSTLPAVLAPAHRFRKLKGSYVVRPAISRGIRNNGHIEIENDTSADEEDTFHEHREYDKVYKLSDRSIKLDFLSKAKESKRTTPSLLQRRATPSTPTTEIMSQRSIDEQQAALNMAALASQPVPTDNTSALISALLAQASPAVISLIAQGDVAPSQTLSDRDRQALLTMKALIEKTLGGERDAGTPNDPHNSETVQPTPKIEEIEEDTDMLL